MVLSGERLEDLPEARSAEKQEVLLEETQVVLPVEKQEARPVEKQAEILEELLVGRPEERRAGALVARQADL